MRIPFPERVNLSHALIFAAILCSIQVLEGTNPFFSGCVFCFLMVAAMGFNIAGGLTYPSGAFIGFNAIFLVILPMVTKIILREPADSNLRAPVRTMEVYLIGMVVMLAAAIFTRRFRTRRGFISGMLPADRLQAAYVGSAVLSVLVLLYIRFLGTSGEGTFTSFLLQADRFPTLTFVLGVVWIIHRSNGRRSVSWPLIFMIALTAFDALLNFSKEEFLTPLFAWAITSAYMRYKLSWINVVSFLVGLYLVVNFMVPYSQVGRDYTDPFLSRTGISIFLLTHMDQVKASYDENEAVVGSIHYYNHRHGLLDRLDILSVDDAIIDLTDRSGTFGFMPMIETIENFVPHFLWPDKPHVAYGNTYAHEIGILGDEDMLTGVSFSPSGDAYHQGRMVGLLIVEPLVFFVSFLVLDCVVGDVRRNPVGLLAIILIARSSVEGMLTGALGIIAQPLFTITLAALVCAYVLPVLGVAFSKAEPAFHPLRHSPSPAP